VPANPNLWYIGVGDANTSKNDGSGDAWARNSYLARLNYGYSGKYLLTTSFRVDGSSRLPSQNRWQKYTSLGVAWLITKEEFMQSQNIFDQLKLRGSYGKVGNDQIPTGVYITNVDQNKAYPFNGILSDATNGVQILNIKDPNIKWENTTEYDLAMEFAILNSKLTGEVNYYHKRVDNAFIGVSINKQVGDEDAEVITNVASVQNKGLEVVLNWKDQLSSNLTYTISGNVTFNNNKVIALNGGQNLLDGGIGAAQGFVTNTDNGQPVGSFYVLKVVGVFNSDAEVEGYKNSAGKVIQETAKAGDFKYLDKNGDGQIDDRDKVFAGSYQPVAYFGLNFGLNYKHWDFSLSIYGNVGNKVYNGKKAVRVSGTDNVERDVVYNRWTSGNHTQSEPKANTGNLPASTYFVESGSFARINNLTVGYVFSPALLQHLKISSLRVFATSQNLFTYKKYSGFTAELPGGPTTSGIELTAYPTTRTIAMGLNVGF
jgi:TonB-linked SusC/RagA family outer membrane protein